MIADPKSCEDCAHYSPRALFELCLHSESAYFALGEADHHTVGHMRDEVRGKCGADRRLFAARRA